MKGLFLLVKKFCGNLILTNHAVPLSEILFLRTERKQKETIINFYDSEYFLYSP